MPGCGSTRSVMTAACHVVRRARIARVPHPAQTYRDLAERSWQWALTRVQYDDQGPWLPERHDQTERDEFSYGMHSGIGGLAHVMSEIGMSRPLTSGEQSLAGGIADTLLRRIPEETEFDYFNGLSSTIGALIALDAPGVDLAVARLSALATPDGWQPSWVGPPRAVPEGRCNDVTIGNASVLLAALWALRYDVPGAAALAARAVDVLLAEQERTPAGLTW